MSAEQFEQEEIEKNSSFWRENLSYLIGFLILWLMGCYALFFIFNKGEFIVFFSNNRSESLNQFFRLGSIIGEGYVYVLAVIVFLFIQYAKSLAIIINSIFVLAFSGSLKWYFEHERPVRYFTDLLKQPDMVTYVEGVKMHDGWTTSFPSGHTTSAFAFYSLLAFFIPNRSLKLLCLLAAAVVGISRIYLVQHFLKDVVAGSLLGFLIALGVYWLSTKFGGKLNGKIELRRSA